MIKVSIYEDNVGLREVLCMIVDNSEDLHLSGQYGHCVDVIQNTKLSTPDVMIMDIDLPGKSGIQATKEVKTEFPHIEIIINTVFDDDDKIFDALCAGASGYVLKKNSLQSIVQNIKDVMDGGSPMSPFIARRLLQKTFKSTLLPTPDKNLSEREREILEHLSRGLSYKMVAVALHISIDTVRSHIKKIYEKLHVHSLTEAIHKLYLNN